MRIPAAKPGDLVVVWRTPFNRIVSHAVDGPEGVRQYLQRLTNPNNDHYCPPDAVMVAVVQGSATEFLDKLVDEPREPEAPAVDGLYGSNGD